MFFSFLLLTLTVDCNGFLLLCFSVLWLLFLDSWVMIYKGTQLCFETNVPLGLLLICTMLHGLQSSVLHLRIIHSSRKSLGFLPLFPVFQTLGKHSRNFYLGYELQSEGPYYTSLEHGCKMSAGYLSNCAFRCFNENSWNELLGKEKIDLCLYFGDGSPHCPMIQHLWRLVMGDTKEPSQSEPGDGRKEESQRDLSSNNHQPYLKNPPLRHVRSYLNTFHLTHLSDTRIMSSLLPSSFRYYVKTS